jgi:hypothetical protein
MSDGSPLGNHDNTSVNMHFKETHDSDESPLAKKMKMEIEKDDSMEDKLVIEEIDW